MLDYKLIEAMAMVVKEGGFDKAAQALHITQSAISQRIKLLESATGQILIARTTPPRATAAGRKLLKHYLKVKRLEDDLMGEMDVPLDRRFTTIAVGLNADSLSTWFPKVIHPFLRKEYVVLDIHVDDQDKTHELLKNGEVMGCISTQEQSLQGCRMDFLGQMSYHMLATPDFAGQWFPHGLTLAAANRAPAILYNRKDELHHKFFQQFFGELPDAFPINYVPSSEKFLDFIAMGIGYGMLPLQQSAPLLGEGRLIDLAPGNPVAVKLYWHCWNLKSKLLESLTHHLINGVQAVLPKSGNF